MVRQALNCALNKKNLLTFTYKQEGSLNHEALQSHECPLTPKEITEALQNKHFKVTQIAS